MTMLSTVEDAFLALCQFILYSPRYVWYIQWITKLFWWSSVFSYLT
jgi:hypothetical protein